MESFAFVSIFHDVLQRLLLYKMRDERMRAMLCVRTLSKSDCWRLIEYIGNCLSWLTSQWIPMKNYLCMMTRFTSVQCTKLPTFLASRRQSLFDFTAYVESFSQDFQCFVIEILEIKWILLPNVTNNMRYWNIMVGKRMKK